MDLDPSVVWDFAGTLVGTLRERPRQLPATVSRVDPDGTVWLSMPGADGLVPASTTADVRADDAVTVEWWGNAYHVTGNGTSPSVGTRAAAALRRATAAAAKVAGEAKSIADAVGQHFWADDNGVHVSNEDGNATGERNILMNSLGILLRQGSAWLASFSDSAVAFYDGLGNAASNVVAQFGADGATIGYMEESHMALDYHSMQMVDKNGNTYLYVSEVIDADGNITDVFTGDGQRYQFWLRSVPNPMVSVRVNGVNYPSYTYSANLLTLTRAPAEGAVIEVTYKPSSTLSYESTKAFTFGSRGTDISSDVGFNSFAEGSGVVARGSNSHAQNRHTVAGYACQTAIGKYNANSSANAFEVGNGTADNARSNAFAVGWDGTVTHDGDVPWTNLTLTSDVVAYSDGQAPMYRKWGPVVTLCGAVKMTSAQSAGFVVQIGQLPDGCRPKRSLNVLCQGSSNEVWLLDINESGVVHASRYRRGDTSVAVATTTWLPFTVTFLVA